MIVHEAPTTAWLEDATCHLDRAFVLLDTVHIVRRTEAALQAFGTEMKGVENSPPLAEPSGQDWRSFREQELLQFTICCANFRKIVGNHGVAAGVKSEDAFYARTTLLQAEILACPRFLLPGHHSGYEAEPKKFRSRTDEGFTSAEH